MDLDKFDTKHYKVIQLTNDPEYNWGVFQKEFRTVEHKSFSLPNAIVVLYGLNQQLESLEEEEEAPVVTLVHDNDPESSLH